MISSDSNRNIRINNAFRKMVFGDKLFLKNQKEIFHNNARSYYLDNLINKRIESQILLAKSKMDYYLDRFDNKNNFHRDYNVFFNINKKTKHLQDNYEYNTIKSSCNLPKVKSVKKIQVNLSKNDKLYKNKLPHILSLHKGLNHKPYFANNFVNKRIYHNSSYVKNNRNSKSNLDNPNIKNQNLSHKDIKSYMKK